MQINEKNFAKGSYRYVNFNSITMGKRLLLSKGSLNVKWAILILFVLTRINWVVEFQSRGTKLVCFNSFSKILPNFLQAPLYMYSQNTVISENSKGPSKVQWPVGNSHIVCSYQGQLGCRVSNQGVQNHPAFGLF